LKHLSDKKNIIEQSKKSLADGTSVKKQVVVKKMKDGVQEVVDPITGKKK